MKNIIFLSSHVIIEFQTDKMELELIPQLWLEGEETARYPPVKRFTQGQFQKAVRTCKPPESDWPSYKVIVLKTAST